MADGAAAPTSTQLHATPGANTAKADPVFHGDADAPPGTRYLPKRLLQCVYPAAFCLLMEASTVLAQRRYGGEDYYEEEPSSFFYKMIVGKFGAFLIVFMGFGGVATVFMTRQGKSSTRVPVMGILMLIVAAVIFAYRVMINAGFFGREHIRF